MRRGPSDPPADAPVAAPPAAVVWGALAIAVAAAAALRFPFLGTESLWYDETFTRAIAHAPSIGDVWNRVKSTEATPPLYYIVTWAWGKLFGVDSDAGLRAVSAVASVVSVPVAFAAVRRFVGDRVALATAALAAVSPVLVEYALDARAYSLLVLLALASIWAMARVLERPAAGNWAAWALASAAALWTHYFAAFLIAAEVCVLVWRLPRLRLRTLAWTAATAALFSPVISVLASQTDSRTDHIGTLPLIERVEAAARQFAMGPNVPSAVLEGAGLAIAGGGFAVGVLLAVRHRPAARLPLVIAGIAIGLPLVLSATDLFDRFLVRNVLMAWVCVAAVAALGLTRLRMAPLVPYLVLCAIAVVWSESDWRYQNADWAGAARVLLPEAPSRPIAVYPTFNAPVAVRYLGRPPARRPVTASEVWVVVEPARRERRELVPLPLPRVPRGFVPRREIGYHGFRLVELHSARPLPVSVRSFGQNVDGQPPSLLAPRG